MTPAGTSNELDVQNGWEENTHTHTQSMFVELFLVFYPRLIEYNIVIRCISKHSYYCCTDCVDLFSPSQLLSVHVCKGLEFRVGYEAFYGNDHGKRKHIHH